MGLLFNSDTNTKKDQILRDIAIVNAALINAATTIDNNGMNRTTINSVGSILKNVTSNVTRISTTVRSMSDSQLSGFSVPWTNGSYIGIMMWLLSMSNMTNQIAADMENYLK